MDTLVVEYFANFRGLGVVVNKYLEYYVAEKGAIITETTDNCLSKLSEKCFPNVAAWPWTTKSKYRVTIELESSKTHQFILGLPSYYTVKPGPHRARPAALALLRP